MPCSHCDCTVVLCGTERNSANTASHHQVGEVEGRGGRTELCVLSASPRHLPGAAATGGGSPEKAGNCHKGSRLRERAEGDLGVLLKDRSSEQNLNEGLKSSEKEAQAQPSTGSKEDDEVLLRSTKLWETET